MKPLTLFFKPTQLKGIRLLNHIAIVFFLVLMGLGSLRAQNGEPQQPKLKSANPTEVKGILKDVFSDEPLQFVWLTVEQEGINRFKLNTNELGEFVIPFSKLDQSVPTFTLILKVLGKEVRSSTLEIGDVDIVVQVDAGIQLNDIPMLAFGPIGHRSWGWTPVEPEVIVYRRSLESITPAPYVSSIYRPLDEWLMMNSSEINLSERW